MAHVIKKGMTPVGGNMEKKPLTACVDRSLRSRLFEQSVKQASIPSGDRQGAVVTDFR
jgi:hypothetical protein